MRAYNLVVFAALAGACSQETGSLLLINPPRDPAVGTKMAKYEVIWLTETAFAQGLVCDGFSGAKGSAHYFVRATEAGAPARTIADLPKDFASKGLSILAKGESPSRLHALIVFLSDDASGAKPVGFARTFSNGAGVLTGNPILIDAETLRGYDLDAKGTPSDMSMVYRAPSTTGPGVLSLRDDVAEIRVLEAGTMIADFDGDGVAVANSNRECPTQDPRLAITADCDDLDATVNPNADPDTSCVATPNAVGKNCRFDRIELADTACEVPGLPMCPPKYQVCGDAPRCEPVFPQFDNALCAQPDGVDCVYMSDPDCLMNPTADYEKALRPGQVSGTCTIYIQSDPTDATKDVRFFGLNGQEIKRDHLTNLTNCAITMSIKNSAVRGDLMPGKIDVYVKAVSGFRLERINLSATKCSTDDDPLECN